MTQISLEQDVDALWDARNIDRQLYTSQEVFENEQKYLFPRTWQFACLVHDFKKTGDFFTVTIGNQPVIIVRNADGELNAFHNACTHRGAVLNGEKCGNYGRVLKCMYHAWSFNLNGQLIAVPYEQGYGPEFDRNDYNLAPVKVDTFGDLVFVAIDPEIPTLDEYLGEMKEHLAPFVNGIEAIGRNSWIYNGNWKLWHENFRDNYHPEFTHRAVHDLIPHYADRGANYALAPGHSVLRWMAEEPNVKSYLRNMKRYSGVEFPQDSKTSFEEENEEYVEVPGSVLAVFPNLDIQPGSPSVGASGLVREVRSGYIQFVVPLSPDKARVDIVVYSSTDDDEAERQKMLNHVADNQGSWGKVSADDTEAAVRCQIGAGGTGRRFSLASRGFNPGNGGDNSESRDEYSLREFYRVYAQYLAKPGSAPETD
ncbi:aromatic ring-hydroxylating oxygenase subunit alpha [Nocardia pseudovaccinii]|uniref:aromatic ring-hydroxylating oxygenase subunit alpha n=1 Tax=Nocardia pseudovaccinii TaxID=189540 RepID=UPI003D928B8A